MLTNQKILGIILIIFIIGASTYFAISKFRTEVNQASVSPSPSPSPSNLTFIFQTPAAIPTPTPPSTPSPTPSELPLARNKKVGQFPGILKENLLQNKKAVIVTAKGKIEFEIFSDVPQAASNFLILADNGYYDNLTFHRVEKGFVVQGGDPLGNGTGGPGYTFADEPVTKDYKKGTVAMANAGPNTNGSQFFIMLEDRPELPKRYTIFGKVIKGMEIVEKIEVGDIMQKVIVQNLQ